MPDLNVQTADPQVVPPVVEDAAPEAQPIEETSVEAHAAAFGPNAQKAESDEITGEPSAAQRARDEATGRFSKDRHRAKSQQASADDVKVIDALTKEYRGLEEQLLKTRPEAGSDSPRVRALKQRIRAVKAELGEATATTPEPAPRRHEPQQPVQQPQQTAQAFTEQEPTLEQFNDQPDPYSSWQRALARYDRRKEVFDEGQRYTWQQQQQQRQANDHAMMSAYAGRAQTFLQQKPDFNDKVKAAMALDSHMPDSLFLAVLTDDKGPELLYHLLDHPDRLDEMRLLASSLQPTEASVALLRRRLSQLSRSQAGTTGSAVATASHVIAPRPPNPVRTGPMKAGNELPGDGHSIAEHAKHWGPPAKR